MANLNVTLELDSQAYRRGIKSAEDATKQFGQSATASTKEVDGAFNKLNSTTEKVAVSLGKLKGIIVGAALVGLTRSAISASDAISDLSKATELSVSRIIELQAALQASGGDAAMASKFVTEFYKSIDEAAQGSDKTQEALGKLGVSLRDIGSKSTADLLDQTVKGFENITDPAQRTALAIQLFGKSMAGVNPAELASKMDELRGKFEQQTNAVNQAAELNDNFAEAMNNVRLAFLTITAPLVEFVNNISKSKAEMETLITLLKSLAVVIAAAFAFTGFGLVVRAIGTIGRGVGSLVGLFTNVGSTITRVFGANSTAMKILRGVGGLVSGIAAGLAAAVGLGGGGPVGSPDDQSAAETARLNRLNASLVPAATTVRPVEVGKELTSQLNSVQSLADGYRRAAQANMDRLTTEVELLGKTKEEQEIIKGTADINKRYADQTAALEEKKKGAKGATLALINKEIANLEQLRISELDVFNITREQTAQYARQQQEIKNIIDLMEQQAEYSREIAEFQNQQQQAVLSAYELVRAQTESLQLTGQREQLEKSIQNLRGNEQTTARELFDLENERKKQLEAIRKIQNLPFEGVGGMKQRLQEINDLYDARKLKIEETAAATKAEQDSFAYGWTQAGEKFRNNIKTDAEYAAQQMSNFTKGFEDAFVKFVQTGKLSFKDLANSMIADFARIQAQKLFSSFMGGGGGGGFFGSLFGGIGKIFGFANGGIPPVGQPSIVGERGPELFVPQSAGRIIPNDKLGGMGGQTQVINTAVTYSIQAVDAQSFKTLLARDPEFIHNVAEQGRRQLPIRSRR